MSRSRLALALMLVITVAVTSLAVAQFQQPNPTFVSALASVEEGDYDAAQKLLREVVEAEPNNEVAWYHLRPCA